MFVIKSSEGGYFGPTSTLHDIYDVSRTIMGAKKFHNKSHAEMVMKNLEKSRLDGANLSIEEIED